MRPATGDDVTLVLPCVLPCVNAEVMDLLLAHFADIVDQDAHAVMMLDGAGWHDARALAVPDNVTLALLPPYSPELNPVERVWLYLRERFLSLRVLDDTDAIIDACCRAWIDLIAEPQRMRSLCAYPWIMKVISWAQWYKTALNWPSSVAAALNFWNKMVRAKRVDLEKILPRFSRQCQAGKMFPCLENTTPTPISLGSVLENRPRTE